MHLLAQRIPLRRLPSQMVHPGGRRLFLGCSSWRRPHQHHRRPEFSIVSDHIDVYIPVWRTSKNAGHTLTCLLMLIRHDDLAVTLIYVTTNIKQSSLGGHFSLARQNTISLCIMSLLFNVVSSSCFSSSSCPCSRFSVTCHTSKRFSTTTCLLCCLQTS